MRNVMMISALVAVGISLPAMAGDEYYDQARVLSVTPQTERVNYPTQSCQTEYMQESYISHQSSPLGAIIGGVAGGLLGSQVGRGNGRVAGAAVGAGIGAVVGDRMGNSQPATSYTTRPVRRCVTVDNWQTVNRGYLVDYQYNGRNYTTVLDHNPGATIPVRVNVSAGYGVTDIDYYQHSYSVPTSVIPGHPVVAYASQPYTVNIQYSSVRGKSGKSIQRSRGGNNARGRRYY